MDKQLEFEFMQGMKDISKDAYTKLYDLLCEIEATGFCQEDIKTIVFLSKWITEEDIDNGNK
jgi:hypothetical protein